MIAALDLNDKKKEYHKGRKFSVLINALTKLLKKISTVHKVSTSFYSFWFNSTQGLFEMLIHLQS